MSKSKEGLKSAVKMLVGISSNGLNKEQLIAALQDKLKDTNLDDGVRKGIEYTLSTHGWISADIKPNVLESYKSNEQEKNILWTRTRDKFIAKYGSDCWMKHRSILSQIAKDLSIEDAIDCE